VVMMGAMAVVVVPGGLAVVDLPQPQQARVKARAIAGRKRHARLTLIATEYSRLLIQPQERIGHLQVIRV
jgi:hypothetical protein